MVAPRSLAGWVFFGSLLGAACGSSEEPSPTATGGSATSQAGSNAGGGGSAPVDSTAGTNDSSAGSSGSTASAGSPSVGGGGGGGDASAGSGGTVSIPVEEEPAGSWRSALYPKDWKPLEDGGSADAQGRFLHDFSYAGYHRGEEKPPYGQGAVKATVDAALGNGTTNATAAIQAAIDSVCDQGGGVVALPAGTYLLKLPSASAGEALSIDCSRLVLRGAGPDKTRLLFDDAARAREKSVIALRAPSGSVFEGSSTVALADNVTKPTRTVALESAPSFAVGDLVVVRNDNTNAFRAEHRMNAASTGEGDFWAAGSFRGIVYPRRVVAVDGNAVELDAPTHYPLKTRDAARVYQLPSFIEESGIESLSIGMVRSTGSGSTGTEASHDEDYNNVQGSIGYQTHASKAVNLDRAHDSWLYDVDSFMPSANEASGVHVLSNGIFIGMSAFRITVENCDFGRAQYRGGGGNGYLFHVQGNDNLFTNDTATNARHGFIFNQAVSGNVFYGGKLVSSRLSDDSHRFLAHANLYEGIELNGAWLQAVNRGTTSTGGGFTATEHVFWNLRVSKNHGSAQGCAVESAQFGWGYAIGSRADAGQQAKLCADSFSNNYWAGLDLGTPDDFMEGAGMGATLYPQSLYRHQLAARCTRKGIACPSLAVATP